MKIIKKVIRIAAACFLIYLLYSFLNPSATVTGFLYICDKKILDNEYYICLPYLPSDKVWLKCDEQTFDKVVVDAHLAYGVSYKYYTRSKHGKLIYIHLNDVIDNRPYASQ